MLQPLTTTFSIKGTGVKTFDKILKGYDELGKKFRKTEKDQSKLWDKMGSGLRGFTSKLKTGTIAIGNGFRKMGDVAGGAFSKMKSAGERTFKFLKRGALGLGAAITGALAVGIKTGIGKEGQRLTLETITGSSERAAELMKYGTKFANVTPFKTSEVSEAVTRLAAGGLDPQKVLQQVGDMSAIMGKPLMQGVEAIIDAQVGEFERMKEFGMTKKNINEFGMTIGFGSLIDKKGSITDINKFNTVMFKMMQQKFGGGMKKLSTTTKGLWSTVVGVFNDGMSQVVGVAEDGTIKAGSFLDTLKTDVLKPLADQLIQWSNDGTFTKWGKQLTEWLGKADPYLKDLPGTLDKIWDKSSKVADSIKSITDSMISLGETIKERQAYWNKIGMNVSKFFVPVSVEDKEKKVNRDSPLSSGGTGFGTTLSTVTTENKTGITIHNNPSIVVEGSNLTKEQLTEAIQNAIATDKIIEQAKRGE